MHQKEILELLLLKEWSRVDLANNLGLSLNTIDRWFCKDSKHQRHPSVEHVRKMREWLSVAREEYRSQIA